jgi:hypothetical protein
MNHMTRKDKDMTGNPFTQPLRVTMNDPQFDWARPRAMRRRLVLAFAALLIVMPLLTWALDNVFVLVGMLVPFVLVMGSLNASVRGLSELRSRDLDEREIAFRSHAYARLYWPGVFLGVAAGLGGAHLGSSGFGLLTAAGALSVFNLAMALPTLWLAWSLPDEPSA